MTKPDIEKAELLVAGLRGIGYTGDSSRMAAGLIDLKEGVNNMYNSLLPSLQEALNAGDEDRALELVVELNFELDHIGEHHAGLVEGFREVWEILDQPDGAGS